MDSELKRAFDELISVMVERKALEIAAELEARCRSFQGDAMEVLHFASQHIRQHARDLPKPTR